jgi:putative ABC transport system permease protein
MRRVLAYLRAFWLGMHRPSQVDADMSDEMRFHIDMETERLQRRGLGAAEAARQAAIAFGGIEKYRGAGRDAFGFTWMRGMSVDVKLGMRMLRKYPGLTAVALFALSLAIGAGAAYREFVNDLLHGKLPFPEAHRIVGIQVWDQESGDPDPRQTANFVAWRDSLRSIEQLAAYRALERNLITEDGRAEPVRGVEISAAAFQIAQVPPLLGRPLQPEDERVGAAPVVVIGDDVWRARLGSDPDVIGRSVRLGKAAHTIVGVMPAQFGLPSRHSLWVPLQLSEGSYPRRQGPPTRMFGKLAPGMTMSAAQAELTALADRAAADFPATDRLLRPVVLPYVESLWSAVEDSRMQTLVLYSANVFFIGLLALCGANIATLVFARTATREVEISVRTALGASRARIAGQLFAEALVLSSLAAIAGLAIGAYTLKWVKGVVTAGMGSLMFWWDDRIELETVLYAAALAVFAALIIGVTPALKATSARVQDRLKQSTGATSGGLTFGGVWTAVIVTQVAVTVIFLAVVGMLGWSAYVTNGGDRARNFPAREYVALRLMLDRADFDTVNPGQVDAAYRNRLRSTYAEFARRLAVEPSVAGATYGTRLPGMNFREMFVEIEGRQAATPSSGQFLHAGSVAVNYFDTFHSSLVAGRLFTEADLAAGSNVAIVDQTFVTTILKGQEAVGRHVREMPQDGQAQGPWLQIVGVVTDLTDPTNKRPGESLLFRPAPAEATVPLYMAVRARTDVTAVMSRLRVIAGEIDPSARLTEMMTLDAAGESDLVALDFFARLLAGVSMVAVVLAMAGVYALMSFTVARRTAEIGIRLALGANPRRIVTATFARAFTQVTIGLVLGGIPAAAIVAAVGPEVAATNGNEVAIGTCVASILLVAVVTALACVVPARRALTIQPTDALKTT